MTHPFTRYSEDGNLFALPKEVPFSEQRMVPDLEVRSFLQLSAERDLRFLSELEPQTFFDSPLKRKGMEVSFGAKVFCAEFHYYDPLKVVLVTPSLEADRIRYSCDVKSFSESSDPLMLEGCFKNLAIRDAREKRTQVLLWRAPEYLLILKW